jgi:hypothetical protein
MAKKTRITRVEAEAKMKKVADWRASTPAHGSSTDSFRAWGKANPNRVSNAARTLREPKSKRTEITPVDNSQEAKDAATANWLAKRPRGGGRNVAAPHAEWVAWGKQKPGRASQAAKTVRSQGAQKAKVTPVPKKAAAPKKGKKK